MSSAFDVLVDKVLVQDTGLSALRTAVEKEILHHDIIRIMNGAGFLEKLAFMGGTCLRMCYGSSRLSEDLDFTGGFDFSKDELTDFSAILKEKIGKKYGLDVTVTEPRREEGNTDTWKIKVITQPERPDFPAQKINIDICRLPARDRKVRMLNNHYGMDFGTGDLLLYAESMEEILCDKLIAFANRPNRVKNRDLWDIFWLSRKGVQKNESLLSQKLSDRRIDGEAYWEKYAARLAEINGGQKHFLEEMKRFLLPGCLSETFTSPLWWDYLLQLLSELC